VSGRPVRRPHGAGPPRRAADRVRHRGRHGVRRVLRRPPSGRITGRRGLRRPPDRRTSRDRLGGGGSRDGPHDRGGRGGLIRVGHARAGRVRDPVRRDGTPQRLDRLRPGSGDRRGGVAGRAPLDDGGRHPLPVRAGSRRTGHGRQQRPGADHDQATNLLLLHSPAAALWLGVLIATWAHLRTADRHKTAAAVEVVRRVRWLTVVALVVLGGTGVGLTWIQIGDGDITSVYGLLALGQAAATVLLVVTAIVRARRPAPAGAIPRPRAVIPDVALVLAVFVVAAITARLPSPAILYTAASAHQIYIGYDVPGPWTWIGLVTRWRVDLFWLAIAVAMIAVYLLAVRSVRRAGGAWPGYRLALWTAGWLLVVVATSSGINLWSSAQFSMHMVLHLILNLAAAPLLVAAAPLGLARIAGPERPGGVSGPREWASTFLHSGLVRFLTRPWVALAIYVITLFGFYLTPLFDDVIRYPWGHQWMNIHFLVSGFLFFWPIVGTDLPHRRPGALGRVAMLLAIMPLHALFGIVLMTSDTLLGNTFYEAFDLLDADALSRDQLIGGVLVWISGELPVLVAVVVLLARWLRDELGGGRATGGDSNESDQDRLLDELREFRS